MSAWSCGTSYFWTLSAVRSRLFMSWLSFLSLASFMYSWLLAMSWSIVMLDETFFILVGTWLVLVYIFFGA